MTPTFTPLHPVIAAECSGIDISRPLSPEEVAAIDAAWTNTPCWCSGRANR